MRKTITPVIAIVLLVMMTVGASVMGFVWINSISSSVQESTGSQIENNNNLGSGSRLNIISVRGDGVSVQNVGNDNINMIWIGKCTAI